MCRLCSRASLGLLVLLLLGSGRGWAQSARTVDARQLLAIARGGLTAAAQAAYRPLPSSQTKNRDFWKAIDTMGHALDAVSAAFAAKSPTFFDALSAGSRSLAELRAIWSHTGVTDPGVKNGIETLSTSYRLLRGSYGWEALRRQQGGALTPEEERRFQAQQQAQAALAARLDALRAQAARAGDAQAASDLARLAAQAQALAQTQRSLEAYLAAQAASEALQGELSGDTRAARPAARKILRKAAPLVEDLTTDSDVGFVFSTDLSKVDDTWAPLAAPVEVPAGVDLGSPGPLALDAATVSSPAAAPGISLLEDEAVEGGRAERAEEDAPGGVVVLGEEQGEDADSPAAAGSDEGKDQAAGSAASAGSAAPAASAGSAGGAAGKETAAKKADGKPDEKAEAKKPDAARPPSPPAVAPPPPAALDPL